MDPDKIDYPAILQDALRGAVRRVLAQVSRHGLPGEHHLFIDFRTDHPGVEIPRFLRDRYPEEMRVVLRNQFWDLSVDEEAFSVSLNFNASRHLVTVPFAALTAFADPAAELAVRFEPVRSEPATDTVEEAEREDVPLQGKAAEVLRFDPKRRK